MKNADEALFFAFAKLMQRDVLRQVEEDVDALLACAFEKPLR